MQDQDFKVHPSRQFNILLILFFLATALYLASAAMPMGWKIGVISLLGGYGSWIYYRHGLLGKRKIALIRWHYDGRWEVQIEQQFVPVELLGDSLVTARVCLLRFKLPQQRKVICCLLFPDSFLSDNYRRLQVLLRI